MIYDLPGERKVPCWSLSRSVTVYRALPIFTGGQLLRTLSLNPSGRFLPCNVVSDVTLLPDSIHLWTPLKPDTRFTLLPNHPLKHDPSLYKSKHKNFPIDHRGHIFYVKSPTLLLKSLWSILQQCHQVHYLLPLNLIWYRKLHHFPPKQSYITVPPRLS